MEQLAINTPALLFSTVSLLMIAFTNRFLAIANLIRELHDKYVEKPHDKVVLNQIQHLKKRIKLIRNIQIVSVISLLFSAISMFFIFFGEQIIAKWLFGIGLSCQIIALIISVIEISISMHALEMEISDIKEE